MSKFLVCECCNQTYLEEDMSKNNKNMCCSCWCYTRPKDKRIAELEEQLKNAIVPKFKIGQEVWWVSSKSQISPVRVIIGDFSYYSYRKHKFLYDGDMKLNFYEGLPECQLFATKEEAQAKLKELQG